jgi:hypothetical protein
MNVPQDNLQMRTQEKQMQVCDICGAFLVQNDAEQRITSHLQGKQHTGFIAIRKKIEELKVMFCIFPVQVLKVSLDCSSNGRFI